MDYTYHDSGYLLVRDVMSLEGYQDKDYCAIALINDTTRKTMGRGVARRTPYDKHDPDLARELALGRALVSAGNRILKRANGRVKHADDVRRERERHAEVLMDHFLCGPAEAQEIADWHASRRKGKKHGSK